MAFVALPVIFSGVVSLSYYFYGGSTETIPQAPAMEIMEKYNTVVKELKTNNHPILQKFSPTLQEIQNTRSNLKPINDQEFKKDQSLMETFVIALKTRRETLNKI